MPEPMLLAEGLTRTYGEGSRAVHALRGVDLRVETGELVAIRGRSGSGKTTLLNLIGGLDRPDAGTIVVDGHEVTGLDEDGLRALRRETVGYVFQTFALIPTLTAAENVGIPLRLRRVAPAAREARVAQLLDLVGLADHGAQTPEQLSGGQQQRVALARALAGQPRLLLADEPTGQLDSHTGREVMALLSAVVHEAGATALVATHDPGVLAVADRVLEIRDGTLTPDLLAAQALAREQAMGG
ncbi:MAG TPA: ABC transporter ATP-binding protein [Actinomycetes bacterium]|nr:ABC transporter ATP-binding protein [Actinomycetes bacterium]